MLLLPRREEVVESPREQQEKQTFKERAQTQVERVRLEGEIERARVAAVAETQSAEVDRIEEVGQEDPAEGRRQISAWLANNL